VIYVWRENELNPPDAPILSQGTNQARRGTKCNVRVWADGETGDFNGLTLSASGPVFLGSRGFSSGKARIATSLQTSYRLDDRNYGGGAKDSDKQEVALHRRQTTTKRSQRGERGQLPHGVHLQDTFHFSHLFGGAPTRPVVRRKAGRGLVICTRLVGRRKWPPDQRGGLPPVRCIERKPRTKQGGSQ
jgi:hypothetical protein